ncbi:MULTISPECIES: hypothetical protein [Bifidobacterium]|nr:MULTISPECIES: hypothetical protein [Bifidobacterium]
MNNATRPVGRTDGFTVTDMEEFIPRAAPADGQAYDGRWDDSQ